MSEYRLEENAHLKLLLHAAKYPSSLCHGLLFGSQTVVEGCVIQETMPLFHTQNPLAPITQIACAMAEAYAKELNLSIVGYYQANVGKKSIVSSYGEKLTDKVALQFPNAFILQVDGSTFRYGKDQKADIQLMVKDKKQGYSLSNGNLVFKDKKIEQLAIDRGLSELCYEFVDFDDHLEDVSRDWRNENVFKLLKVDV